MLSSAQMRSLPSASRMPGISLSAAPIASSCPRISRAVRLVPSAAGRAPSGFNLYTKKRYTQVREELQAKGKPAKLGDVNLIIRDEWKAMPDKSKQPFMAESDKLKGEVASAK